MTKLSPIALVVILALTLMGIASSPANAKVIIWHSYPLWLYICKGFWELVERRGYSYTRFSTPPQADGDSQRRQDKGAEAYALRMNITLDRSLNLKDVGFSAYSSAHKMKGAFGKFMVAVEAGSVPRGSILIVEAIDRLTREHVLDAFDMISAIIRGGVEIHTIEDGEIYSWDSLDNGKSRLLAEKIDAARYFSQRLSRRLSAAWTEKRTVSRKPLTRMCPAWLRVDNEQYRVIEPRATIVRRIFEETANGIGRDALAKRLNEDLVPTFSQREQGINRKKTTNTLWHSSYIQKIVNNRAVIGYYQPHEKRTENNKKRIPVGEERLLYPPVVTVELWERAQLARKARFKKGGRRGNSFRNILSGLCFCANCDGRMTYRYKGKRRVHLESINYLMCDKAVRGGQCDNTKYFQYERTEKAILDTIISWHTYDASLFTPSNEKEFRLIRELANLNRELEKYRKTIDNLMCSFEEVESKSAANHIRALELKINETEEQYSKGAKELESLRQFSSESRFEMMQKVRTGAATENSEQYEARAFMHQALSSVIEFILFGYPSEQDIYVVLKGWLMTFQITQDFEITDIGFHNNGTSMFLVGDGFTERLPSPQFIIELQRENPDAVNRIRKNMSSLTFEQAQRAASGAVSWRLKS